MAKVLVREDPNDDISSIADMAMNQATEMHCISHPYDTMNLDTMP